MTTQQYLLVLALLAVLLVIVHFLVRSQRNKRSKIDLEDLLLGDDGRMSKAAAVMLGAFVVTTWMMIYITIAGKMTEGYLGLFMTAWVAPTVTNLIVNASVKKAQAAPQPSEPQTVIGTSVTMNPPKE